jgi:hypothetical protein
MKRIALFAGLASVVALTFLAAPTTAQETERTAELPPGAQMTQWTNALMGSVDIAAILPGGRVADKSVMSPPGGQDPLPICAGTSNRDVSLDRSGALGAQATARGPNGTLIQVVYVYADRAAADAAWLTAHRNIDRTCDDATPGSVNSGQYATTLAQIDDSIQLLWFQPEKGKVAGSELAAMEAATPLLAQRWAERETLPLTQSPLLTLAEGSMLADADVPSALPIMAVEDGAWSMFDANAAPFAGPNTCRASARLPSGLVNFTVALGSTGDVFVNQGAISQSMQVYASVQDAQRAWRKLRRVVGSCTQTPNAPIRPDTTVNRLSNGVSPLTFQGNRGVWSRSFSGYGSNDSQCTDSDGKSVPCATFSTKLYEIHLLVGNAIQTVSYYTGRDSVRQMPLDQESVNALAQQLAERWVAGAAQMTG